MNTLTLILIGFLAVVAVVLLGFHRQQRTLGVSAVWPVGLFAIILLGSGSLYAQLGRHNDWDTGVADDRAGYLVDKAINQDFAAIEQTPGNPSLYLRLADNLASKGRYGEAVDTMDDLIAVRGEKPNYLGLKITYLYYRDGRFLDMDANMLVARALALDPHEYHTRLLLATDAYRKGEFASAIEHWDHILQQPPAGVNTQPIRNAMRRAELKLAEQTGQS